VRDLQWSVFVCVCVCVLTLGHLELYQPVGNIYVGPDDYSFILQKLSSMCVWWSVHGVCVFI